MTDKLTNESIDHCLEMLRELKDNMSCEIRQFKHHIEELNFYKDKLEHELDQLRTEIEPEPGYEAWELVERAVIGGLFANDGIIQSLNLTSSDFKDRACADIFSEMLKLVGSNWKGRISPGLVTEMINSNLWLSQLKSEVALTIAKNNRLSLEATKLYSSRLIEKRGEQL